MENWFEINDNVATAIDARKIATQFEGSESAYILFYRRKSLVVSQEKAAVPEYFARSIREANEKMSKERELYEEEKSQIILIIEGEEHKLRTSMSIDDFKQAFVPEGSALVLESEHNGLPFYPMQVANHPSITYKETDTISSLEMPH
jgi:hypothetical protein